MGISSLDCSQVLKSPFVRIMLTIKNQAPSFMTMCEFCNVWKEEVNELNLSLQGLKITPKMSQFYKVCHTKTAVKTLIWMAKSKMDGLNYVWLQVWTHLHCQITSERKNETFIINFQTLWTLFLILPNIWVIKLPFSRPIIRGLNPNALLAAAALTHLYLYSWVHSSVQLKQQLEVMLHFQLHSASHYYYSSCWGKTITIPINFTFKSCHHHLKTLTSTLNNLYLDESK